MRNSAAVIFAYNHPSGVAEPSAADRVLTDKLRDALRVVEIRALDHFVVGGTTATSFAERGGCSRQADSKPAATCGFSASIPSAEDRLELLPSLAETKKN